MSDLNLNAIRDAIKMRIAVNPTVINAVTKPKIDNGHGILVDDYTATAVITELGTVTMSRRTLPDLIHTNAQTPYDYLDNLYIVAEYDATWIDVGIEFYVESYDETYRTKIPERKVLFGGCAYIVCGIETITSRNVGG